MYLLHDRDISLITIKKKALVMEAPAPVIMVYIPHDDIMRNVRILFAYRLCPKNGSIQDIMPYMMPRWRPDKARMCEAPLSRNVEIISGDISDLSPVISADMISFVAMFLNGIFSMPDLTCSKIRADGSDMNCGMWPGLMEH